MALYYNFSSFLITQTLISCIIEISNTQNTLQSSVEQRTLDTSQLPVNGALRRSGRFQCHEQQEDIDRIQRQGEVRCRCPTNTDAFVCGSDGKTYHNRCFLDCAARHKYHRFGAATLRVESLGRCPDNELLQSK